MIQQIDTELKSARGNYRERLLAVRAYKLGYSVSEIANLYGKTRKTVYNWINRYDSGGPIASQNRYSTGRPLLVNHNDEFVSADLRCALNHGPDESGYATTAWTAKLFAYHIQKFYGVAVSVSTAWRLIRRLGYTMQRPGRVPAGGDERARNAWRIALSIAEQNCPADTLILFGDEAGFNIDPTIIARWAPRGRQPKLATSGRKHHISLIGAITRDRSIHHFLIDRIVNAQVFCRFLAEIHRKLRQYKRIYLVVDNVSFHRSRMVRAFAASLIALELILLYQLAYSPYLNPIEKVWKRIREKYPHNRVFYSFRLESVLSSVSILGI